jgi:[ribosomal protein S5]-alanine N-acetyltransferase
MPELKPCGSDSSRNASETTAECGPEDPRAHTVRGVVVRTDRLVLRPPASADGPSVYRLVGDPRTVEHNPSDLVRTQQEADALLQGWIRHWHLHGFGYWCIEVIGESTGVIGVCGVKVVSFRSAETLNLLYRLVPEFWGRGYASEAACQVVSWVQREFPGRRIIARVRPANLASQRVAIKARLHHEPALDDGGEDGPDLIFTT